MRARTGHRADGGELLVRLRDRQGRLGGRRRDDDAGQGRVCGLPGSRGGGSGRRGAGAQQIAQRRVAHADLALAQLAGQKRHGERHLVTGCFPQQASDEVDLRPAARHAGDLRGDERDLVQQHSGIVL